MGVKCWQCGLVNFAHSEGCRRCQMPFANMPPPAPTPFTNYAPVNNYYPPPPPPPPVSYAPAVAPYPNQHPPYQPSATVYTTSNLKQYYGIGGWLIIPAIILVLTPMLLIFGILQGLASYSMMSALENTPGLEHVGGQFRSMIVVETLCNLFLLAFVLSLAVQFFKKKKLAPNLFIAFLLANLILAAFDYVVAQASLENFMAAASAKINVPGSSGMMRDFHFENLQMLLRATAACLIWIPYFKLSKRVKATFIH